MDINNLAIEELSLSVRATNCLRRAGARTFGDMVALYISGNLCTVRNLGKKCQEEVIDKINEYRDRAKLEEQDDDTLSVSICAENYNEWLHSDSGINFILSVLKEKNTDINELFSISARTYNILRLAGKEFLHQVIFLNKTELMNIDRMDNFSASELVENFTKYLEENKDYFIARYNESNLPKEETIKTVFDILYNYKYCETILAYVKANDIFIGDLNLDNRPKNQLLKNGFSHLSDIIFMKEENFYRLPAMGVTSAKNIVEKINEYLETNNDRIIAYCHGDTSSFYTDCEIANHILNLYKQNNFVGLSFNDFKEKLNLPEEIEENSIKSIIGKLIFDGELEYVDYRCYRKYSDFRSYLEKTNAIDERSKTLILKRLDGETLEGIGIEFNLTRERIRQIVKRDFEKVRNQYRAETGTDCYDEDYYEIFYKTYSFDKHDAEKWLGISQAVFNYMDMRDIKQGSTNLLCALDDEHLDIGLKLKVKNYLNRNKIFLDGMWVEKKRSELENYFLSKYCKEDISFSDFYQQFNIFLESEKIPYDENLYYTDKVLKSRRNRLGESRLALWKQNELIRYYDIDAHDYDELFNTLNLDTYENIELSTLKFMDDYPEIMKKYDIRDQYELHNLLRKIVPENSYNNFHCGRTPIICFGKFDRNEAVTELIMNNAPVTLEELQDLIRKEYGFESGAITWKNFNEYYYQGVYRIDYKAMSENARNFLKEKLTEDFYYIDEIKKIYKDLLPDADLSEINPYNLKLMGFSVFSRYACQNYASLEAYFTHLLTKSDIIDITPYRKRFTYVQAFTGTLTNLKKYKTIFEFDPNHIISRARLELGGVTDDVIESFCDNVFDFVKDNIFFSIKTLKNEGFEHEIFELGFSDWFYANILAEDSRFSFQQIFNNIILYKGKTNVTIKAFEMWLVKSFGSIDSYDLMTEMINYGCKINEKSDITYRLNGTEIYYDNILDRFYSSAEAYYRELEEAEVVY